MQRLVFALALVTSVTGCKKKQSDKTDPPPVAPVAPVVAVDAPAAVAPVAQEPYRMKKGGVSELVKLDPLPAGWTREDGESATLTHVVEDASLEDGKLEILVFIERLRMGSDFQKPADWSAEEVKQMQAKLTKTETVGNATIFDFKADREWFWAYVPLDNMLWRCGTNLQEDQKLPAVRDAVATARKLCASMML